MAYYGTVKITDRLGWAKSYPLEKSLLMIGSGAGNDIILPEEHGSGVAPLHVQVFRPQVELGMVRVVNLAPQGTAYRRSGGESGAIGPGSSQDFGDGDSLSLGEYSLLFTLQSQAGISRATRSEHLGLKLELPSRNLRVGARLAGQVTVTNYGDQRRCQFELELEGLPAGCFRIDPAPLLFPGAEEHLQIRFFHRGTNPEAGLSSFTLRACAPVAYPTEMIAISETLEVSPVYGYELSVLDPFAIPEAASAQPEHYTPTLPPQPAFQAILTSEPLAAVPEPVSHAALSNEANLAESFAPSVEDAVPSAPEQDWWAGETSVQPAGRADPLARLASARRPRLSRDRQPIPVYKPPEPEPDSNPPSGEQKTP